MRGADLDHLAQAAEKAAEREAEGRADPEPSLGGLLGSLSQAIKIDSSHAAASSLIGAAVAGLGRR